MNNREGLLIQAKEAIRWGKDKDRKREYGPAINFYNAAIQNLLNITPQDETIDKLLAQTYYDCSYPLFNSKQKQESAEYLEKAIKLINPTLIKNDQDYRLLTRCNFVLSDTLSGLYQDGNVALQNSIKAFNAIKNKTKEEKELGNPQFNPQKFFDYYNIKTCHIDYRNGTTYQVNQSMLSEAQNNQVFLSFTDMTTSESTEDNELSAMMSKSSVITMQESILNNQYRQHAKEAAQIALNMLNNEERFWNQSQINQKQQTGINLFDRALKALNLITQKNLEDEKLKQQIEIQKQSLLDLMDNKNIPNSPFSYATSNQTMYSQPKEENTFEFEEMQVEKDLDYKPERMFR